MGSGTRRGVDVATFPNGQQTLDVIPSTANGHTSSTREEREVQLLKSDGRIQFQRESLVRERSLNRDCGRVFVSRWRVGFFLR